MTTVKVQGKRNRRSGRKIAANVLVHAFLAVLAAIWVLPIFWIVLTSFRKEPGSYVSSFFPKGYTLNNYIKLFTDKNILNFPKMFTNTLIIAIFTCLISTFFVMSVGYSLSRMRFKFRKPYMNMAMILGLFPGFMAMIAQYYLLKAMGLTEGGLIRLALIIAYTASTGLGFQIVKGYFDTIPRSIDEAAVIDGATQWQVFTQITLPLAKPILMTVALFVAIMHWNSWFDAYLYTSDNNLKVMQQVLVEILNQYQTGASTSQQMAAGKTGAAAVTPDSIRMAATMVATLPIIMVYPFIQKYFVKGIMLGAVKG